MKKVFITLIISIFVLGIFSIRYSNAAGLATQLKGRILLQVESNGEAWYINPDNENSYFLGRPEDAFHVMRELGLGISNSNFESFKGYAPKRLSGKILLKVEDKGQAYYVNPVDLKMHFLGRPADAFQIMRQLGLGISNSDISDIIMSSGNYIVSNNTGILCAASPRGTAIGRDVYPINEKYKNIHFLGQLFTAYFCGQERLQQIFGVDGENYTLGSAIRLENNPDQSLIDTFNSIGFKCAEETSDASCKKWELKNYSMKIEDIMKLEPYYNNFKMDDCRNCG